MLRAVLFEGVSTDGARRRRALGAGVSVFAALAAAAGGVTAARAAGHGDEVNGHTTAEVTICPDQGLCPTTGFTYLQAGPGEPHLVRQELTSAKGGRETRRTSLAYFAQISDFQLADEESPARVENLDDEPSGYASSAWRPQEAMLPQEIDRAVRQVNRFLRSPIPQAGGVRAPLLNAVLTGDLADSQQRNETQWAVQELEGGVYRGGRKVSGMLDPNSGTKDRGGLGCRGNVRDIDNPRRYTGVQDYSDYPGGTGPSKFYDPNRPAAYDTGDWPRYPGLMDQAQRPFAVEGLKVPSYVAFGNHDNLVQGNQEAVRFFEDVATGCVKPLLSSLPRLSALSTAPAPDALPRFADAMRQAVERNRRRGAVPAQASAPGQLLVPRDENRQYVNKVQAKALYATGRQRDAHGFGLVDPGELQASNGAAAYYDFSPKPGIRYVIVDTVSEGGRTPDSSEGNIDDPQFHWLNRTLAAATRRNELIFVFSHHAPSSSLDADVPDENAPCTGTVDRHGHDDNPGCDRDPRRSTPIHLGPDTIRLVHRYPHVVAWIAGHSHENKITPMSDGRGGGYWEVKSPAIADWTTHHRLLELMDNHDGTLSVFGTLLDFAAPIGAPPSGTNAGTFDARTLAAVGRTLTYNDPQQGPDGSQGTPADRNVELLLRDPRRRGRTITGTPGDDVLRGTSGDDVIICGGGNDRVYAGAGNDVVHCGPGNDVVHGGSGNDRLYGEAGNDRLFGESGDDRLDGGSGDDHAVGASGRDAFVAVERRRP